MMSEEQPRLEGTSSPLSPHVSSGVPGNFYGTYGLPADAYNYSPTTYDSGNLQTSQFFPFFGFPYGGFGPFLPPVSLLPSLSLSSFLLVKRLGRPGENRVFPFSHESGRRKPITAGERSVPWGVIPCNVLPLATPAPSK